LAVNGEFASERVLVNGEFVGEWLAVNEGSVDE